MGELYPNGTAVYTPFPDYEEEVPATGSATQRVTFSANGQVAVAWKKAGAGAAALYSLHTNHLGSVVHVGDAGGARIDSGCALYEPFGAFSHAPTGTNPDVTDRGFTGHRQNNWRDPTGTWGLLGGSAIVRHNRKLYYS